MESQIFAVIQTFYIKSWDWRPIFMLEDALEANRIYVFSACIGIIVFLLFAFGMFWSLLLALAGLSRE